MRIYIGSAQCVGQNTWLYLQTVLFLCSCILFDKSGLETRVCCKKAFVLFSERAHTRDSTRVATRVHLTIIERTHVLFWLADHKIQIERDTHEVIHIGLHVYL